MKFLKSATSLAVLAVLAMAIPFAASAQGIIGSNGQYVSEENLKAFFANNPSANQIAEASANIGLNPMQIAEAIKQGNAGTDRDATPAAYHPTTGDGGEHGHNEVINPNSKPLVTAQDVGPGKAYEVFSTLDGRTRIATAPAIEGCNAGLVFLTNVKKYWCPGTPKPVAYVPPVVQVVIPQVYEYPTDIVVYPVPVAPIAPIASTVDYTAQPAPEPVQAQAAIEPPPAPVLDPTWAPPGGGWLWQPVWTPDPGVGSASACGGDGRPLVVSCGTCL